MLIRPLLRPGFPRGRVIGSPHRFVATSVICGAVGEAGLPPCRKPGGDPPRRQPMTPWDKEFKLIESASRPVGKKRGYPTSRGPSFRCLTPLLRLSGLEAADRAPHTPMPHLFHLPAALGARRGCAPWIHLDYHHAALRGLLLGEEKG